MTTRTARTAKRITIIDRPARINLANYEQRLRKFRTVFALLLADIDEGLQQAEADRKKKEDADDS